MPCNVSPDERPPKVNFKTRLCLKCQGPFASRGPENRICADCNSANRKKCVKRVPPVFMGHGGSDAARRRIGEEEEKL